MSLQEQRDAITRYADHSALTIVEWFEERVTAAKRGRPIFTDMLRRLTKGATSGVIIHKIDRSARNLRDWADLGELIDRGIQVYFAHESLDLHTRGGRLAADVQAVVAADYIRNLREETRKGFYGRLKQGLYPLPAPVGYRDCGKAKPKELDPVMAPIVRAGFERYATGQHTLDTLGEDLFRLGLRNRSGQRFTVNGLSVMLNNPFYTGLIRLRRTGEVFPGIHEPIVTKALFDRVHAVLTGKVAARLQRHEFLFRRLVSCANCDYSLIGEMQRTHIYYRCHSRRCPTTGIREEALDAAVRHLLGRITLSAGERAYLGAKAERLTAAVKATREGQLAGIALTLRRLEDRLRRLTDAYVDGVLEKELFADRKGALLEEKIRLAEQAAALRSDAASVALRLSEFLEQAAAGLRLYETGTPAEKRELVQIVTSNRGVRGKDVEFVLAPPFSLIAKRAAITSGAPYRDRTRTSLDRLTRRLWRWFVQHPGEADDTTPLSILDRTGLDESHKDGRCAA